MVGVMAGFRARAELAARHGHCKGEEGEECQGATRRKQGRQLNREWAGQREGVLGWRVGRVPCELNAKRTHLWQAQHTHKLRSCS